MCTLKTLFLTGSSQILEQEPCRRSLLAKTGPHVSASATERQFGKITYETMPFWMLNREETIQKRRQIGTPRMQVRRFSQQARVKLLSALSVECPSSKLSCESGRPRKSMR